MKYKCCILLLSNYYKNVYIYISQNNYGISVLDIGERFEYFSESPYMGKSGREAKIRKTDTHVILVTPAWRAILMREMMID